MKTAPVKLILVISLSLLVVIYNNVYADTTKSTAAPLVKPPVKLVQFRPDIKRFTWEGGQPPSMRVLCWRKKGD